MKSEDEVVNMNYRSLMLIGYATALIMSFNEKFPLCNDDPLRTKSEWFLKSIDNMFYLKKALPPLPEI